MGVAIGRSTTGAIGGVAKAAPPPGTAESVANVTETIGKLGKVGQVPLGRAVKVGAGGAAVLGAGGLAASAIGNVTGGLLTNREREFNERVERIGDKASTAARAAFQEEANAGGAWSDPTWPARLHAMLTRQGERPKFAVDAGIPARNSPEEYTSEELRTGWIAWLYGHRGPAVSKPLTAKEKAAVEKYLRERAAKRPRRRGSSGMDPGYATREEIARYGTGEQETYDRSDPALIPKQP
jgi:hypothetical protein